MANVRIELRAKNAELHRVVTANGGTVASFCRDHGGLSQQTVGGFINLTVSPYMKDGRPRPITVKLSEIAVMLVEDLFPTSLYRTLVTGPLVGEVSVDRFVALSTARMLSLPAAQETTVEQGELQATLAGVLKTITPRERLVITRRFGLDVGGHEDDDRPTYEEVGAELGVTLERVRQIEKTALRKLRHPSRSRALRAYIGRHVEPGIETTSVEVEAPTQRPSAPVQAPAAPRVEPSGWPKSVADAVERSNHYLGGRP
jgi:RNA polymerase sigma factor (sigma-70 family)